MASPPLPGEDSAGGGKPGLEKAAAERCPATVAMLEPLAGLRRTACWSTRYSLPSAPTEMDTGTPREPEAELLLTPLPRMGCERTPEGTCSWRGAGAEHPQSVRRRQRARNMTRERGDVVVRGRGGG